LATEANVLVPQTTDQTSKTPAFKSVLITLEAELIHGSGSQVEQGRGRVALQLVGRP
jgi:hypothetical protein